MRERERVAMVSRSHGAWLVYACGSAYEDLTPIEQFDAASSLRVAKRIAVEDALAAGYERPVRWTRTDHGSWHLSAMYDEDAVLAGEARAHARAYGYPDEEDE